jgi:hypothetical protein
MRILALATSPGHCGIGDYNRDLTEALRRQGHQVELVELRRSGDRRPPLRKFVERLPNYDGAIIQHELTFFGDTFESTFGNFAETLPRLTGARFRLLG